MRIVNRATTFVIYTSLASKMSTTSKVVFGASSIATFTIVAYVHLKQEYDRNRMKEGVVRDIEQQQMRKLQNIYLLEQQKQLASMYKEHKE